MCIQGLVLTQNIIQVPARARIRLGLATSLAVALTTALVGCGDDPVVEPEPNLDLVVVTFNTGTTQGLAHDDPPDDGYTSAHADISDMYYGDGLAWLPAVAGATAFLTAVKPDIVGFQEIFYAEDCATIPVEAHADFYCETWSPGTPTVASAIVGLGYQVACHPGKSDKCVAIKKTFGSLRGCTSDFCLEGLAGTTVTGCGMGARVARGVVDLVDGRELTIVNIHGSSGFTFDDKTCRGKQFDQVFVDLGDGEPAANGDVNLVFGDLNTDPVRLATTDLSAARFSEFAGDDKVFQFISAVAADAPASYQGQANIDHVVSDRLTGDCWIAGLTDGHPAVLDATYFDHKPVVCAVQGRVE